jgi:hypothetical protein
MLSAMLAPGNAVWLTLSVTRPLIDWVNCALHKSEDAIRKINNSFFMVFFFCFS